MNEPICMKPEELKKAIHGTVEEVFDRRFEKKFEESISAITSKVIWNWKTLSVIFAITASILGLYWQQGLNTEELEKLENSISDISLIKYQVGTNGDTLKIIDDRLRKAGF